MCGIALLASGITIVSSSPLADLKTEQVIPCGEEVADSPAFSVEDLEAALRRRGPDSLGTKKLFLNSEVSTSNEAPEIVSFIEGEGNPSAESLGELVFIGATLQLRGIAPVSQPFVDSAGSILVYNGEIFGGMHVDFDKNDAEVLMKSLGDCCTCHSPGHRETCNINGKEKACVSDVLSSIKGPWAIIYWQSSSKTLWFGRDAFGRRSLVVHWPSTEDSRFMLSSVSPTSSILHSSEFEEKNGTVGVNFWEEFSCGIYSISVYATKLEGHLLGELKKHEWVNAPLKELIKWERNYVEPKCDELCFRPKAEVNFATSGAFQPQVSTSAEAVLMALRKSMMRRTSLNNMFQAVTSDEKPIESVPVAILFSGGIDSMILAALLDQCLEANYEIDLLNVSFDGESAPDRISAKKGVQELRRIAPSRRWRLVLIDADLSKLTYETKHVMSLINPANTYMDLNIGIALWLASGGEGWVSEEIDNDTDKNTQSIKYKSKARILLVGSGADEQCAGYGRHRTKYRNGSWRGLHEEMKLDMHRIWKRNLGRDDRCIADNGREARFPFLDEDVIRTLLDLPLWEVADLNQPSGTGDKKILREVARMLGLHEAASLPKRAIQFGSRIARESNRKNFGSNRAANQASAGSAVIHGK